MNDWFGEVIDIDDEIIDLFISGKIDLLIDSEIDKMYTKDEMTFLNSLFICKIDSNNT